MKKLNRVLNRVIELYGPKKIVMENLNFMGSKLGKQLNRLLHRCGLSQIKVKLDCLKQEHDIEIKHVYPAYTSQTCSKCQYVDKTNRKNQAIFQCKCCHKKINADVNASRNLVRRSNQTGFYDYMTLNNISSLLVNQFIKNNFVNKKSRIISYQSLTELVDKNPLKGFYLTAMKLY